MVKSTLQFHRVYYKCLNTVTETYTVIYIFRTQGVEFLE